MKKVILGFVVIMLAVVSVSCSKKSASPKDVVTSYLQAMKSKDYEKAANCFYYEGSKDEIKTHKAQMVDLIEKGGKAIEGKGGIKSFKIDSVEEDGDTAVVKGEITYGNGDVDDDEVIKTKKIDGNWYIDMDK